MGCSWYFVWFFMRYTTVLSKRCDVDCDFFVGGTVKAGLFQRLWLENPPPPNIPPQEIAGLMIRAFKPLASLNKTLIVFHEKGTLFPKYAQTCPLYKPYLPGNSTLAVCYPKIQPWLVAMASQPEHTPPRNKVF